MEQNAFQLAAEILKDARDGVLELVKNHDTVRIGIQAKMNLMINQLNFMGGSKESTGSGSTFKKVPITNFMGEELTMPKSIATDELTPQQLERKIFDDKVDRLNKAFDGMTNDQLKEAWVKVDPVVVRKLAKNAGVENFRDGELNDQFLEDIRLGRKAQVEHQLKVTTTENALKAQQ